MDPKQTSSGLFSEGFLQEGFWKFGFFKKNHRNIKICFCFKPKCGDMGLLLQQLTVICLVLSQRRGFANLCCV